MTNYMTPAAVAVAMLRLLARLATEHRDTGHLGADEAMGIGVEEAAAALYRLADALKSAGRASDAGVADADGDWLSRRVAVADIHEMVRRWERLSM